MVLWNCHCAFEFPVCLQAFLSVTLQVQLHAVALQLHGVALQLHAVALQLHAVAKHRRFYWVFFDVAFATTRRCKCNGTRLPFTRCNGKGMCDFAPLTDSAIMTRIQTLGNSRFLRNQSFLRFSHLRSVTDHLFRLAKPLRCKNKASSLNLQLNSQRGTLIHTHTPWAG